jgi:hypothetical protein
MKTYDEFLTWAAAYHYNVWINSYDFNESEVAWGYLSSDILTTAAAIYGKTPFDVNQEFKARLAYMYGNPLTGDRGVMQLSGAVSAW